MDTITHAFAGALLGKALFTTRRSEAPAEFSPQSRLLITAATIGSIFPDVDFFYQFVSRDNLAILKYHRYITHSLVLLPLWAVGIALLLRWGARRLGIAPPSFGSTALAAAFGLASHILLDVVTAFGTMMWSPLSNRRIQWDTMFVLDFTLSALLLAPQMASWAHRDQKRSMKRASRMWALFTILTLAVAWLSLYAGFPFSLWIVPVASAIFAMLFFLPLAAGLGTRIRRSTWARGGLLVAGSYLLLCAVAHHLALTRLQHFAANLKLNVQEIGSLPLPPSMLQWDGLIRTPDGAYRLHQDLFSSESIDYDFYPDNAPENLVDAARQLPETQTYLWFARFPIYRLRPGNGNSVLEISDLRFMLRNRRRSTGFAFRVTFDSAGRPISGALASFGP
jgi:membrane-bound metal-dependent hydrolase YbcI (DUF457 family)